MLGSVSAAHWVSDASWGSLFRLSYDISLPMDAQWVFSGGVVYSQYIVSVGEVVYKSASAGKVLRENINKSINISIVQFP